MMAMLWKEGRENAYKVGAGLAVVVLVHLLRQLDDFNRSFAADLNAWATIVGGLTAAVLAMDAIAGERSRGSLEFLLVRPISTGRILAAKWLVGSAGLLVVTAAFWAMVYATPLSVPLWSGQVVQALHDVSWPAMVYAWFLPLLVAYTTVFAASAATENPAEAAGLGAIVALFTVLAARVTASLAPALTHAWTAGADLLEVPITRQGEIVRLATRPGAVLDRTLLAVALMAAGMLLAWWLVARRRDFSLGRRTLVISGFAFITLLFTVPRLLPDGEEPVDPVGTLRLGVGAASGGLRLLGEAAYVLKGDTLLAIDVSSPAAPRLAGRTVHERGWSLSHLTLVAGRACALGHKRGTPSDSLGVLCFDLSAPLAPRPAGRLALAAEPGVAPPDYSAGPYVFRLARQLVAVDGVLVLGTVSHTRSALRSITFDMDGNPGLADELELETYEYPERTWEGGYSYSRAFFVRQHQFSLAGGDGCVYLGTAAGLRTIGVGSGGSLTSWATVDLGDARRHLRFGGRTLRVHGDTLWVARVWPRELLRIDVRDPEAPVVLDVHPADARQALPRAAGYHYAVGGMVVRLYASGDLWARTVPVLTLADRTVRRGATRVVLRPPEGYAVFDDVFAVFELPTAGGH